VLGLIKRTSTEFRQTVVMITHNNDIARLADRIVRADRPSALRISAAAFWEFHGEFFSPGRLTAPNRVSGRAVRSAVCDGEKIWITLFPDTAVISEI